ncbi:YciI family protein [Streptomyces sp. NPDC003077]|uniref:YciI family protein n=1 Tax=Streptomyces sp. NPDC003077 TaxID=3154443 RepID=UPI0033B9DC43
MTSQASRRRDTAVIFQRMGRVRLFAVFMRPTAQYDVETERGRELMLDHLDWLLDLEDEGRLFAGGPFRADRDKDEEQPGCSASEGPVIDAGGVFVIGAESVEEARLIAAREPFLRAGWRTCTVRTWLLNEGRAVPVGRQVSEDFHGADPTLGTASWERVDETGKGA